MKLSVYCMANRRGAQPQRWIAHAWLILALLVVQVSALTHALTHVAPSNDTHAGEVRDYADQREAPDSQGSQQTHSSCLLCTAFAATGAALVAQPLLHARTQLALIDLVHYVVVVRTESYLSFSSRAPPPAVSRRLT